MKLFVILAIVVAFVLVGIYIMIEIYKKKRSEMEIIELTHKYERLELIDDLVNRIKSHNNYLDLYLPQGYKTQTMRLGFLVYRDGICVLRDRHFDDQGNLQSAIYYPDIMFESLGYNSIESANKRIAISNVLRERIYRILKNKYGDSVSIKPTITRTVRSAGTTSFEPLDFGFVIEHTVLGKGLKDI